MKYLYKYGYLNQHSEELFVAPRVWFSSPSELNDPFECRPWNKFDGSLDQIADVAQKMLQKQCPDLTSNMAAAEAAYLVLEGRHRDLQVQKLVRQVSARWLLRGTLNSAHLDSWNAYKQGVLRLCQLNIMHYLVVGSVSNVGLFCLSSVCDNILMWSHYTDQHHGYCVEFSSANDDYMFGAAEPVSYSPEYPVVEFFNASIDKQTQLTFLTKHEGWAYEREWRIIDTKRGAGFRPYPAKLFKGVIFGLRMPESDRARIREWVGDRGHPVTFYEYLQDDRRFAIEVKEVE